MSTKLINKVSKKDQKTRPEGEFPFVVLGFENEGDHRKKKIEPTVVGRFKSMDQAMTYAENIAVNEKAYEEVVVKVE